MERPLPYQKILDFASTVYKERASPSEIRSVIAEICSVKYFKLTELSKLIGRSQEYVRRKFLAPMVEQGKLELLYPHQPNHPQQAYRTKLSIKD